MTTATAPAGPGTRTSEHDSAVAEIVGMIRAAYREEGHRNFAIGKRAFEHAQWQKGNFPAFGSRDFDTLMKRIREGVREHVPIKAESIQVAHWVRCHVLRELVRAEIADHADSLTMFEYLAIAGKALHFSTKDLEGDLNPEWLDFIKSVAYDRAKGQRVSREAFEGRVAETVQRIACERGGIDPAAAAERARKAAAAKANVEITTALSDGLSGGHVTGEGALSILETVARHHAIPLPSAVGFDPARCTPEECDLLASAMFSSGKYVEMVRLRDRLTKMVAAMEKAHAAHRHAAAASLKIA